MPNILETVTGLLQGGNLGTISQLIGADNNVTKKGIAAITSAIIPALSRRTADPQGASSVFDFLSKMGNFDITDNIAGFLTNPGMFSNIEEHAKSILGDDFPTVVQNIGKLTGLDNGIVGQLIGLITPVITNTLGKIIKTEGFDAQGLTSFLQSQEGILKNLSPGLLGFLGKADANGDGNVLDDLGRLADGFFGGNK